jgi:hypothetical protein
LEQGHQQSLPVFVHPDEHAHTRQAAIRKIAFLEQELALLPGWHPMAHEYQMQLNSLLRRQRRGPVRVLDGHS